MPVRAADDVDAIRENMIRIKDIRIEMCPQNATRTLHLCLRLAYPLCSAECPHRGDWIGPQTE